MPRPESGTASLLILPPEGLATRAALELPYLVLPCGEYGNTEITVELTLKLRVLIPPLHEHVVRPERPFVVPKSIPTINSESNENLL